MPFSLAMALALSVPSVSNALACGVFSQMANASPLSAGVVAVLARLGADQARGFDRVGGVTGRLEQERQQEQPGADGNQGQRIHEEGASRKWDLWSGRTSAPDARTILGLQRTGRN